MNYRHAYHTGNFADSFKHIVLIALLQSLLKKESAFCFLDTHAGIGFYDLLAKETQKSREFETGVLKIIQAKNPPKLIQQYVECVRTVNFSQAQELQFYPGSPSIARQWLRQQDRIVLCELHDQDYLLLKKAFPNDKQVAIHHQDGYQALKAFLPPKERRGLVLIDPPYEKPDELTEISSSLAQAVKRWETGIYALWYPIKERRALERFQLSVSDKIKKPMLLIELSVYPENIASHLNGSGMLIVNPPWQLDDEIAEILPWLWQTLSINKQGRYEIKSMN
jgi:23S rRNA (adenine2030-N6)-methyltransferase